MFHPRWVPFGISLVVLVGLLASPASANLAKCESKLFSTAQKLNVAVGKAMSKCSITARSKGINDKTADACEKSLAKVFNLNGLPGAGTINKTIKAVDKLFVQGKEVCTSEDLEALGLLESGVNAPGVNAQDFLVSALVVKSVDLASSAMFASVADLQESLTALVDITNCNTSRPNLCSFAAEQNPDCRVHACVLGPASNAYLQPGNVPVSLQNRVSTMQICQTPNTLLDLPVNLSSDYRALFLDASKTFRPPPVATGTNATICIDQIRAQGWCDCNGGGVPFEPDFCLDGRVNNNGGTCSNTSAFCLTDADCPKGTCSGPGVDGCGGDLANAKLVGSCVQPNGAPCEAGGTTRCYNSKTGGRCHPGTYRGEVVQNWGGASGPGDCMLLNTVAFRVLPPALCVNGGGGLLGTCTTTCNGGPCAPDVGCSGLGGVNCIDPKGADQRACTADDLFPPSAPTTVPFTTGSASTTIVDRLQNQGACSAGSTNVGMNCASNQDCDGGTCQGAVMLSTPRSFGPGTGLGCDALDSSSLSGLKFVGTFPALNVLLTFDTITEFELVCN